MVKNLDEVISDRGDTLRTYYFEIKENITRRPIRFIWLKNFYYHYFASSTDLEKILNKKDKLMHKSCLYEEEVIVKGENRRYPLIQV